MHQPFGRSLIDTIQMRPQHHGEVEIALLLVQRHFGGHGDLFDLDLFGFADRLDGGAETGGVAGGEQHFGVGGVRFARSAQLLGQAQIVIQQLVAAFHVAIAAATVVADAV